MAYTRQPRRRDGRCSAWRVACGGGRTPGSPAVRAWKVSEGGGGKKSEMRRQRVSAAAGGR
eukprot:8555918-Pyramimonas_sp.AAC.1